MSAAIKHYKGIEVTACATREETTAAIIDKIAALNSIRVSEEKLNAEVELMKLELRHRLQYEQMATGIADYSGKDLTEQFASLRTEAERQLKADAVIEGVIAAEQFAVTQEELEAEAAAMAKRKNIPVEMVKGFFGPSLSPIKKDLLRAKALAFVYDNAVIH